MFNLLCICLQSALTLTDTQLAKIHPEKIIHIQELTLNQIHFLPADFYFNNLSQLHAPHLRGIHQSTLQSVISNLRIAHLPNLEYILEDNSTDFNNIMSSDISLNRPLIWNNKQACAKINLDKMSYIQIQSNIDTLSAKAAKIIKLYCANISILKINLDILEKIYITHNTNISMILDQNNRKVSLMCLPITYFTSFS